MTEIMAESLLLYYNAKASLGSCVIFGKILKGAKYYTGE